jgi:hypothetical protein
MARRAALGYNRAAGTNAIGGDTQGRRYVAASGHHFQCRREINRAGNPGGTDLDLAL